MQFYCKQEILSHALQIVSHAIPSRSTLPILSGIFLEYKKGTLLLRTTDLEIGMELVLNNLEGEEEGSVVISGKRFTDIIRYLPPENISISCRQEDNQLSIETSHSAFELPILPVQEFPALPEIKSESSFKIPFKKLKDGIKKTGFATLPDDIRPFLTAVLFELAPGKIKMVATDINRLAVLTLPLPEVQKEGKFLIPTRTLQEIGKLSLDEQDEISVDIGARQVRFTAGNLLLISRLVEAQFPEYEKVIPKSFKTTLLVNRNAFLQSLERASLLVPSVRINIEETKIYITANEPEIGRANEELETETKEGENIVIGFNSRFLTDFLNAVSSEEIKLSFSGEEKPAVIEGAGEENYFYVVMPMRLN